MRYLRGEILGLFCGELGIRPSSRVAIAPSRQGLLVWDLSAGVEFNLNLKGNSLRTEPKPAPERCHAIFHQPDFDLLARLTDPSLMPWSEERETLLSELRFRRLTHDTRLRYPLRPRLLSFFACILPRLNPVRLLRSPEPNLRGTEFK
jgi:hypothetical protein